MILLPSSKTDQTHEGQSCIIPYGNEVLCPVTALTSWLEASHIKQGAIFRRITLNEQIGAKALTPLSVNHLLKKHAHAIGINDFQKLSCHSLRRGFATSAAKAGVSLPIIMRDGRWKQTNTVVEYIEASERFSDNTAASVLQAYKP